MIPCQHGVIRTADPDDAHTLKQYYDSVGPRAAKLDRKREVVTPTTDELQELLTRKENEMGGLYAIEDRGGRVQGFCSLRGVSRERRMGEALLMLIEDRFYAQPLAAEALDFLLDFAFNTLFLNKLAAHCLENETAARELLIRAGFESEGTQRDVVFTEGRWHDLEAFACFRRNYRSHV
ncbi:MAG TPA: GNAT family N-acetyltransferase [Candidatus Hydrogenedentes bacterium]|nr:GNAT family N-acetyltransferase [Candidatus Hydrogenedentota bacterium]HIJ72844.1 GNAT family N-acetyltransferase [Candidatus Hydrogenedentota bacterium]